jgi:hypothetical protein
VRATGKLHLDVSGSGGVTAANEATRAASGTEEHRFKIAAAGTATLRGVGDDLTWAFNAIPDKPPTVALTKDPEQQNRGSLLLSYRVEDDYGATEAHATFARKEEPASRGDSPHPLYGPPDFALVLPQARTRNGVAQTIKDVTGHPWAGAEVVRLSGSGVVGYSFVEYLDLLPVMSFYEMSLQEFAGSVEALSVTMVEYPVKREFGKIQISVNLDEELQRGI